MAMPPSTKPAANNAEPGAAPSIAIAGGFVADCSAAKDGHEVTVFDVRNDHYKIAALLSSFYSAVWPIAKR
ncbi:MAG: hypothetical protein ACI9SK_000005 [Zhongshania sp.]|jgi:hypothetical protein